MEPKTEIYRNMPDPVTLQLGAVSYAVDDLMHGYDTLISKLPKVNDKLATIQYGTQKLASDLEVDIEIGK